MMADQINDGDGHPSWPTYAVWTIGIAFGSAIAALLGNWLVESVRARITKTPPDSRSPK